MHCVIKRNAIPSLVWAEVPGVNVSKGSIYALLLWLLLNSNGPNNNQSRRLVGLTETQLTTQEMHCASWCLACDHTQ